MTFWGVFQKVGWATSGGMPKDPKDNGFKLKEGGSRLDVRKKSFMMRVARPWTGCPEEPHPWQCPWPGAGIC